MRQSGILLAISALPSSFGIGDLGGTADDFAALLTDTGQSLWQILPVTIPDHVHSPYASPSAFAGDPLLLSPALLSEDGLLSPAEAEAGARAPFSHIDYEFAAQTKMPLLHRAFAAFRAGGENRDFAAFCHREQHWLDDFALFSALKTHFDNQPWWKWEKDVRDRNPAALSRAKKLLSREIDFHRFTQYAFMRQFASLRWRLHMRGIRLIGDIPLYVARDSADVWAHPKLFQKNDVAGVPPDFFSSYGQLWGNPLYDWEQMAADGFSFWIARLSRCAALYDVTRLDHFRALDAYYAIPAGAADARVGAWLPGPGAPFFDAIHAALPQISLIAEDLGALTPSVHALRDYAQIPGMRVMQFAFGGNADNSFLPHNFTRDTVAYLGTHDNDTTAGWWRTLSPAERTHAAAYLGIAETASAETAVRRMMAAASASVADTVIFTMQDLCVQGSAARVNTPAQTAGCWRYAAPPDLAPAPAADFLRTITRLYGRAPSQIQKGENA